MVQPYSLYNLVARLQSDDNSESTTSVPTTVIPQSQIPPVPVYEADNKPQSLQVHYPSIMISLNVHSGAHQRDIHTKLEIWVLKVSKLLH